MPPGSDLLNNSMLFNSFINYLDEEVVETLSKNANDAKLRGVANILREEKKEETI